MRDIAIRVEGLGKQYRIGARAENNHNRQGIITPLLDWEVTRLS